MPDDLARALAAEPRAQANFELLSSQNRYAVLYRIHSAKRSDTRARRIEQFVAMLARGETIHPQKRALANIADRLPLPAQTPAGTACASRSLHHRRAHGLARVLGLEHGGVAGFLEDLAHEPVDAGEAQLDDDRAVAALLHDAPRLARPARALGGDEHPCRARGLDLAGAQPAVDLRGRVDLGAGLEALLGHVRRS